MATLQALSSSRVKDRGLNYDETIIMKIREDFIKYVDPKILLLHLPILSTEDEEKIDARQNSEGRSSAARLLLQLLPHYPEWIPRLLESLIHPNVRLEHLAEKIEQSLGVKEEIESQVKCLSDEALADAEKTIYSTKEKLDGVDEETATSYIDKAVKDYKAFLCDKVDKIVDLLEMLIPKEPKQENFPSTAEYKIARKVYVQKARLLMEMLKLSKIAFDDFLSKLGAIIKTMFQCLKEVWRCLKESVEKVVDIIKDFMAGLKDTIAKWLAWCYSLIQKKLVR